MLTAGDVMTRDVITVKKKTTIRELAELFNRHRISSAPVVDDNGEMIGIVTETDLIEQDKNLHIPTVISLFDWVIYLESDKKFEKELNKMTGQTVGEIYSEEFVKVTPATPVSDVADILSSRKMNAIPVLDGNKIVGIVARIDLIRTMIKRG
ncbi:MAG: CBS domain-containing protein [Geobacteraceae bacterium]|jgi:CBS-domain-containing membrane protein